ncbi:MAG: histidine kinase [Bacteroidetes bacterium HGW-Bacteroidetes-9]|jgi:nitrogen-specific signal transduction histidine kinase|nr:MAG: histidine kinase [Bacteroidetes bacterium HGW-Bacteroidetes-9]
MMDNSPEPENSATKFASPERVNSEEILKQYNELAENQLVRMISDAIPDVAMILNKERQVVFQNKALMTLVNDSKGDSLLGSRPGEILDCLHAADEISGCGTSESCRYCGAVNAILECQRTGKSSTRECRITAGQGENIIWQDLLVTASPFVFNDKDYVIFSIKDISDQKRRKVLERMFFHDVLNTATGLNGLLLALKGSTDSSEMIEYIDIAEKASNDLIEDLLSQRALSAAESGDLQVKISRCSSIQVLHDIAAYLMHHEIAGSKRVFIDPFSHSIQIETDTQLLKRVLINLVKNALEASPADSTITLGSRVNNNNIRFWVNNPTVMPEEVQKQIFQRSFSTKGVDRGIGTYSVKLLTTQYLKGKVDFETNEDNGTTFRIDIPMSI